MKIRRRLRRKGKWHKLSRKRQKLATPEGWIMMAAHYAKISIVYQYNTQLFNLPNYLVMRCSDIQYVQSVPIVLLSMHSSAVQNIGLKKTGIWSTTALLRNDSWMANPVIANIARRPLNISPSSMKRI